MIGDQTAGKTGGQKHRDARPQPLRVLREFDGRYRSGHHDVREQQVERRVLLQKSQRDVGILGCLDAVAPARQHVDDGTPDILAVLDHEDALRAAHRAAGVGLLLGHRVFGPGQVELHAGALPDRAVDADVTVRLAHEAVDHAEPQPRAFSVALGREEGIERLGHDLGRHAGAGVSDIHQHIRPGRHVGMEGGVATVEGGIRNLDPDGTAIGHGVPRIDRQVEDGVLELACIDLCVPGIVSHFQLDGDALAQRVAHQVCEVADQSRHVRRLRRQRLAARKSQELLGQAGAAIGSRRCALHPRGHRGIVADLAFQQVQIGANDLQDVVEVVRHAAGELAGRFHLLALAQRRLVMQLLRDVDAAHHRAATRHLAAIDLVVASVMGDANDRGALRGHGAEIERQKQRPRRGRAFGQELIERGRRLRPRFPLRQLSEGLVPRHHGALVVDDEDRITQTFQRGLQQPRPAGELELAALQPGRTADNDIDADDQADECAGHDQQARDVGLLLLGSQRRHAPGEQQPLPLDQGIAQQTDLPQHRPAGAGAVERERRLAAVQLVGAHRCIELFELLRRDVSEFPELAQRVGIVSDHRLEQAHVRLYSQTRPFVGFEAADVTCQQEAANADLGVLHRNHHFAHQAHRLVVRDHEPLLASRGLGMGQGQHQAGRDQHCECDARDHAGRARRSQQARHLPDRPPPASGRSQPPDCHHPACAR